MSRELTPNERLKKLLEILSNEENWKHSRFLVVPHEGEMVRIKDWQLDLHFPELDTPPWEVYQELLKERMN